jgi:hypothetical protein
MSVVEASCGGGVVDKCQGKEGELSRRREEVEDDERV